MADHEKAWDQELVERKGEYTLEIRPKLGAKSFEPVNVNGSQRGGRPIVEFLPHRVKNVEVMEGKDLAPVVTDNFVLIPNPRKCEPDRIYRVKFRADRI
jgi:zinc protease